MYKVIMIAFLCVTSTNAWTPSSWRGVMAKSSAQIPKYYNTDSYQYTQEYLSKVAPLIFAEETRLLKRRLALATVGEAFVYIGGDCAETFKDSNTDKIWKDFRLLLEISLLLTVGLEMPIVKIARIAGQYAKPRSDTLETRNGTTLPSYQGDIINGRNFTSSDRTPNPLRMIKAYHYSCQSLNILRAFVQGGYSGLKRFGEWRLQDRLLTPMDASYEYLYSHIRKVVAFLRNIGLDQHPKTQSIELFTGHEALLLPYEEPLVRKDSITNDFYACSAHFLWIGERTRQIDGPHVEFLRGVQNPIGLKISHEITPEELLNLTMILNPENEPGKLTVMTRMGWEKLESCLPGLIGILQKHDRHVVWVCDPMHANTKTVGDKKTRYLADIWKEMQVFCDIHWLMNSTVGGIHLESTGQNVTEVLGGELEPVEEISENDYMTAMDPRLNYIQTIELCLMMVMHFTMNYRRP
jgi:3-deoxy-7-phosphoheptulonate synthase